MTAATARPVRLGVVGAGNIARQHIANVTTGAVTGAAVAAIASRSGCPPDLRLEGVEHFADYGAMLASGRIDAVLVAAPTMLHRPIGEEACRRGLHLLMEKPLAMSVADAQALLDCAPRDRVFAVMLNQRVHPAYRRIREIVSSGGLGDLRRMSWTMTHWYRPDVYFRVSEWRGTWRGEGGGLLLNQCIHNLDVLQWVMGMPRSVRAQAGFGRHHDIEVEDEATACLAFDAGVTGVVVASTGEAPGINQLDIIGDRGTLRYDGNVLRVERCGQAVGEHCRTSRDMFGMPRFETDVISFESDVNQHAVVLQNFVDAIAGGAPLMTPASEGLNSLELANGILLSAWLDAPVTFPLDRRGYQRALDERIAGSSLRRAESLAVNVDISESFR